MTDQLVADRLADAVDAAVAVPSLMERARTVAAIARAHADEVDRDARAPIEAIAAMRSHGLLAAAVPAELGGEGATLAELSEVATELGAACAATGMVFAMHQGQAMALWRHGRGVAGVDHMIAAVRDEGALLASSTTEKGIGGDARHSLCNLEPAGVGVVHLHKDAPVISYAEQAQAILVTARSGVDASSSDQRLVVCPTDSLTLVPTSEWDTLGLRGTCSGGWLLDATVSVQNVLADDYATISATTVLPVSHVLWASVWLGIAVEATSKARATVRKAARAAIGTTPPSALRLAELLVDLQTMADSVRHAAARFDAIRDDREALGSVAFAIAANSLKIAASDQVVDVVTKALRIVGISGYRRQGEQSIARHLRDAHGAAMQVSNDRLLQSDAQLAILAGAAL